jgi:hypothetical protein
VTCEGGFHVSVYFFDGSVTIDLAHFALLGKTVDDWYLLCRELVESLAESLDVVIVSSRGLASFHDASLKFLFRHVEPHDEWYCYDLAHHFLPTLVVVLVAWEAIDQILA